MLLLLACAPAPVDAPTSGPNPAAMDELPGRRTVSPSRTITATVAPGGALSLTRAGRTFAVDTLVDPRLAFSPDEGSLVYARQGELPETDLWITGTTSGIPARLVAWPGSEDRPVFSPDGRRLAFVSGRTGIAAWWVIDLATPNEGRQLTNVGLEDLAHTMGEPPPGFVPVPDGLTYSWTDDGLVWVAEGVRFRVVP